MESIECRCCPRICAGFYYITPPPVAQSATPPAQNHPRKLCLRGARWAVGILIFHHSYTTAPTRHITWGGGHSSAAVFGHSLPCHSRLVHPTNTLCLWGPGRGNDKNYCLRDIKFPPCPPHKHNVFVGAPGAGNDRVFVVRWVLYYLADETPGITGMMVPPGLGTGIVAVGL